MNNLNKLLNLLSTPPKDGTGLLGGQGTATPNGSPAGGNGSFQDVLARLAKENQGGSNNVSSAIQGSAPQSQAGQQGLTPDALGQVGPVASFSETTIAVTESLKASNSQQLLQAEQALGSLVTGLAHVISLLSQMQQGNSQQVQDSLKALGIGQAALPGLQNLINQAQAYLQNLPAGQNPLALQTGQQTALLGQMFQQMIQNQQVLFGVTPAAQTTGSNAAQTGTGGGASNAVLQVLFSETQADVTQGQGLQASQVFINLQTFKMNATFIQAGQGATPQTQPLQSQGLLNNLNQALADLAPANNAATGTNMAQTVPATGTLAPASQNDLNQNFKNLVQLLMQSGVGQAVLTTFMRNQQQTASLPPAAGQTNTTPAVSANNLTQAPATEAEIQPANPVEWTAAAANNTNNPAGRQPVENTPPQDNVNPAPYVGQAPTTSQQSIAEVQVNNNTAPGTNVGNLAVQNQANVATVQAPLPQTGGLPTDEIAALNDTVARLNASALNTGEGNVGANIQAYGSNFTMDQVLSSLVATHVGGNQPPTFGNPYPVNPPAAPAQANLIVNNTAPANAGVPAQAPANAAIGLATGQPNTTPSVGTSAVPALSVSPLLVQPVTPSTQPGLAAVAVGPVNPALLGNGAGALTLLGNNNPNPAVAPGGVTTNTVNPNPATGPVTTATTVVPLPQPAALPSGVAAPAGQANVPTGLSPAAPMILNQAINPAPTSQAPSVPTATMAGEGMKTEIPATTTPRNENFANPSAVANTQPLSSVIPVSPEAVAPTGTVLETGTGLGTLNVLDKNAPNNAAVLEEGALLGLSNAANQAAGSARTTSPAALSVASGGNFDTVSLLGQISQQIAAQTAQSGAVSRLNFQLIPESLGRVTVQIALVDQAVSARIVVTNPEVRDALQTHMVDLKSALNQAGLQIDQLQVQVGGGGGGNLLAQYYQYQQEGFGYRLPVSLAATGTEGAQTLENTGNMGGTGRLSLVDVLA